MKGVVIVALGINILAVPGVVLPAASSVSAQDNAIDAQALAVLAGHLRPRWIEAGYRTDLAPPDDPLHTVDELKLVSGVKGVPKRVPKRPSLLLIFTSEDEANQVSFEQILFHHPDLVMGARVFVCLRLDVRKNELIAQRYDGSLPRFLVFDRRGRRRADISMAGFRQRPDALLEVMKRVARHYSSIPLDAFIDGYRALLVDLVPIDSALMTLAKREATLARKRGADVQAEKTRLHTERQEWQTKRKAWLARERALLREYHGKKK